MSIAIVDYGMGNLRSVQKALEKLGHKAEITSQVDDILSAERVIVPGVGAFADAMQEIQQRQLVDSLREAASDGIPMLGICLGLQLFFETSYEDGTHEGLSLIPGKVVRFSRDQGLKVPHMGWNQVRFQSGSPLFNGLTSGTHFYFVHSYYAQPEQEEHAIGIADYGVPFCAVAQRDNVFATQFHPEKSQKDGLQLLDNFAKVPQSALR